MKTHYTAKELAGLPVTDWPATERAIQLKAEREVWKWQKRTGRGGGREYDLRFLPKAVQTALLLREAPAAPALPAPAASLPVTTAPAAGALVPAVPERSATALADWQRGTMAARVALVRELQRLAAVIGTDRAVQTLLGMIAGQTLPETLAGALRQALGKGRGRQSISRATLYGWLKGFSEGGELALAPKAPERTRIEPWAPYLLAEFQQPQKSALTEVLARLRLPEGITPPSYDQARRLLARMNLLERNKGRSGPRELKNLRTFRRRDTSQLWPCDIYTSDGHTFDAEVQHPEHGRPFRPEITPVLDVATRRCVGWSVALAESALSVLDAFCRAVETAGIPALFYVDNGAGFKNAMLGDEATGVFARIGCEVTHSLPYNSQARGIIERFHRTVWVRLAKSLPTYMGASMDREARQTVHKLTRAEVKAGGTPRILPSWQAFVRACEQAVAEYNDTPHRALPKFRDADGKLRHRSPNEEWAAAIAEGFRPDDVSLPAELVADLYRPCEVRKTRRGEVSLWGNRYFDKALEGFGDEFVRVHYDVHDASRVWVRDRNGALICVAGFEANRDSYMPLSRVEQARAKRAAGREKRLLQHLEEIHLERGDAPALPGQTISDEDARLAQEELHRLQLAAALRETEAARQAAAGAAALAALTGKETPITPIQEPAAPAVVRPRFRDDFEMWCWVHQHPDHATPEDRQWLDAALRDDSALRLQVDAWTARHAGKEKPAG